MKPIEMFDRKRAAKTRAMICAGAAVFVLILQYSLTLSFFQRCAVAVLLGLPLVGAAFWIYKVYLKRVGARTRKGEEVARLHLAIVEALATAIDAKDQTTHFHVRRVQIYAAGLGKLFNLSEPEVEAQRRSFAA